MGGRGICRAALVALAIGTVASSLASAQPDCTACDGHGRAVCSAHAELGERMALYDSYCSVCAQQCECRLLGWTPCDECKDPVQRSKFKGHTERLEEARKVAKDNLEAIGGEPILIRSRHFFLVSTLREDRLTQREYAEQKQELIEVSRTLADDTSTPQRLSAHLRAHLYIFRAERVYDQFMVTIAISAQRDRVIAYRNPYVELYLMGTKAEYQKWVDENDGHVGMQTWNLVLFPDPDAVTDISKDQKFHLAVAHKIGHRCLERFVMTDSKTWLPGWLNHGYAHLIERTIFGYSDYYCSLETSSIQDEWNPRHWGKRVKKLVRKGKNPSFAEISQKNFGELSFNDHLVAWSMVDYLVQYDQRKFRHFCEAMRDGTDQRDALMELYSWTETTLEKRWGDHVRRTYGKD